MMCSGCRKAAIFFLYRENLWGEKQLNSVLRTKVEWRINEKEKREKKEVVRPFPCSTFAAGKRG